MPDQSESASHFSRPPVAPKEAPSSPRNSPVSRARASSDHGAASGAFQFTLMHGLIAGMTVLLAGVVWYFVSPSHTSRPSSGTANAAVAPSATPKKPPVKLSADERRAAGEALQGLQSLRSVTEAGLNYAEYSRRVLDGKVQVDRYLNAGGGNRELKGQFAEALELYLFAGTAWNAKIREAYFEVSSDRRIDLCPAAREFRDGATSGQYVSLEEAKGIRVATSVPLIWSCTSARVREIERELNPEK